MKMRIPPPLQGLSWAAIMWAIAIFGPALVIDFPGRMALVIAIALCGLIIEGISVGAFIKARTTVNPINLKKSSGLVTSGLYRFTRNPMYLGMLFLLVAWGLYLGNPLSLVGAFGFVFVLTEIQIKPEEAALETLFGEDYLRYKRSVRRWL